MILTSGEIRLMADKILLSEKWREKFKKEKQFNSLLKEHAIQFLKEHPEFDITKRMIPPKLDSNPKAFK